MTYLTQRQWRTFTTNYVVAETHALIVSRLNRHHAAAFLRQLTTSTTTVIRASVAEEARARDIIFKNDDKDFALTDAVTFAVMERLGIVAALTFDRHFAEYGFADVTSHLT